MNHKDHKEEYRLQEIGTVIALIAGIGGLLAGGTAYLEYIGKGEAEAKRALHEAQLSACRDVSLAAAKLFSADDQQQFGKTLDAFAELKHGPALTILDKNVLHSMVELYNIAISVKSTSKGDAFRAEVEQKLCNQPFEVGLQCRKMLSSGFNDESGGYGGWLPRLLGSGPRIELLPDDYVQGWTRETCTNNTVQRSQR